MGDTRPERANVPSSRAPPRRVKPTGSRPGAGIVGPSGTVAIDILIERLVAMGLAPATAMGVLSRAARRHHLGVEALAVTIVTGTMAERARTDCG